MRLSLLSIVTTLLLISAATLGSKDRPSCSSFGEDFVYKADLVAVGEKIDEQKFLFRIVRAIRGTTVGATELLGPEDIAGGQGADPIKYKKGDLFLILRNTKTEGAHCVNRSRTLWPLGPGFPDSYEDLLIKNIGSPSVCRQTSDCVVVQHITDYACGPNYSKIEDPIPLPINSLLLPAYEKRFKPRSPEGFGIGPLNCDRLRDSIKAIAEGRKTPKCIHNFCVLAK